MIYKILFVADCFVDDLYHSLSKVSLVVNDQELQKIQ